MSPGPTPGTVVGLREADQHLPRRPRGGGEHVSRLDRRRRDAEVKLREAGGHQARRPRAMVELREAGGHVSRLDARARPRGGRAARGTCLPARRPHPTRRRWSSYARPVDMSPGSTPARGGRTCGRAARGQAARGHVSRPDARAQPARWSSCARDMSPGPTPAPSPTPVRGGRAARGRRTCLPARRPRWSSCARPADMRRGG